MIINLMHHVLGESTRNHGGGNTLRQHSNKHPTFGGQTRWTDHNNGQATENWKLKPSGIPRTISIISSEIKSSLL